MTGESAACQVCLVVLGGSWIWVYIQIIRLGCRDRTFGMPIVAFCGNIAWECYFAFVAPYEPFQRVDDTIWFVLDLFILATIVRYGPREFPLVPRSLFYPLLGVVTAIAFTAMAIFAHALGSKASIYLGFGDTLVMEALFVQLALARRSMRGQSLAIGYVKWIGTAFGCAGYYFFDANVHGTALIALGGVAIFITDGLYVAVLHALRRESRVRAAGIGSGAEQRGGNYGDSVGTAVSS